MRYVSINESAYQKKKSINETLPSMLFSKVGSLEKKCISLTLTFYEEHTPLGVCVSQCPIRVDVRHLYDIVQHVLKKSTKCPKSKSIVP